MTSGTDDPSFYKIFAYEPLVRWNPEWTQIIPNVAERWEVNTNGTNFTFYLRKGMKWSDGAPFTATTSCSGGRTWSSTRTWLPTRPPGCPWEEAWASHQGQ